MDFFLKNNREKSAIKSLVDKFVREITMETDPDSSSTNTRRLTIESSEIDEPARDIDTKLTSLENLIKKLQSEIDELSANADKPIKDEFCSIYYTPSKPLITEYELRETEDTASKNTSKQPIFSHDELQDHSNEQKFEINENLHETNEETKSNAGEDHQYKLNDQLEHKNSQDKQTCKDTDEESQQHRGEVPTPATREKNEVKDDMSSKEGTVLSTPQQLCYDESCKFINKVSNVDQHETTKKVYEDCREHEKIVTPATNEENKMGQNDTSKKGTVSLVYEQVCYDDSGKIINKINNVDQDESTKEVYEDCQDHEDEIAPETKENKTAENYTFKEITSLSVPQHVCYAESSKVINVRNKVGQDECKEIYEDCDEHKNEAVPTSEKESKIEKKDVPDEGTGSIIPRQVSHVESSKIATTINNVADESSEDLDRDCSEDENAVAPATKEENELGKDKERFKEGAIISISRLCYIESSKFVNNFDVHACFNDVNKEAENRDQVEVNAVSVNLPPVTGTKGENDVRDVVVTSNNSIIISCKRNADDTIFYDRDTIDEGITELKENISETIASLDNPDVSFEYQDAME